MDPSHSSQPQSGAYGTPAFDPPPAASGAGQQQDLPLSGMNVHQAPTGQSTAEYHPPPPPPRSAEQTDDYRPPQPPRPGVQSSTTPLQPQQPVAGDSKASYGQSGYYAQDPTGQDPPPQYNPATFQQPAQMTFQAPPKRQALSFGNDDPSDPVHYTRDPHKLVAYLVPFPKPQLPGIDPATIPSRFLIYTPPPPPLTKPGEGEKEAKFHMVQRKWQEEVRHAKTSTAKVKSWEGVKSRVTRGINKAMEYTTSSNLDFLGRVSDNQKTDARSKSPSPEPSAQGELTTKKTVGIENMLLCYPPSMGLNDQQMREEFVNTMLRTKTKAERDAVISTGLMPVAFGIDILATLVWPFGGLGEIDAVWAYANIRGVKTARSVTKRLSSSGTSGDAEKDELRLDFTPSRRIELLQRYLAAECNQVDTKVFPQFMHAPTETEVVQAIGWHPSQTGGEQKNWEDEQWELSEVKDDLKTVMHKGAKEWRKWCFAYAKDPEKAMNK